MTHAEVLRAARAKIERPSCWCQNAFALGPFGESVDDPTDEAAVMWCAMGALLAADGRGIGDEPPALIYLERACPRVAFATDDDPIAEWNDDVDTTHADVLALFDRAIAAAERAERGEP